jgi:hypothetical protein
MKMKIELDDNEYELTESQMKAITQLYNAVVGSVKRAMREAKDKKLVEATIDDIKLNVEFIERYMKKLKM